MSDETPWGAPTQPPTQPPAQPPAPPPPPSSGAPPPWTPPPAPYGPPAQPPRRGRARIVLAVVAAVVVVGAAVAIPLALGGDDDPVTSGGSSGAPTATDGGSSSGQVPPGDDLSAVEEYDGEVTTHVTDPVTYDASPPVGGAHYPAWAECGAYDAPLPDEVGVHDLEHGAFWFTYDPDALDDDQVAALADQLPDNAIMSPYPGLDAPVVVTVWERQLRLTGPDDPRLALFLDAFAGGVTAPEAFASCAGGLSGADLDAVAAQLGEGTGNA